MHAVRHDADRVPALTAEHPGIRGGRWVFFAVALAALAIRLAPLLRGGTGWAMNPDSARYIELAQGLRAGCGFARWLGHCGPPEVLRTPAYPWFLALMPNPRAAVAVQGLIGAGVCLMAGLVVAAWWGMGAGLAAELLLAFDAPSIVYGAMIMSDIPFQALFTAAIVLQFAAIRRGLLDARAVLTSLAAAALIAVAVLVRPVGFLLPFLAPLPLLLLPWTDWRATLGWSLLALAIPALVTIGWMARNKRRVGVWTLTTDIAVNGYFYKAAGVVWYRGRKSYAEVQQDLARPLGWQGDIVDIPATLESAAQRRALEIYLRDPVAAIIMTVRCTLWLAVVPDRGNLNNLLGTAAGSPTFLPATGNIRARLRELARSPLLAALVALQLLLIALIWAGVARALWRVRGGHDAGRVLVLTLFGVAVVMMALAAGADAFSRYRVPSDPFLAMLAGIGWFGRPPAPSASGSAPDRTTPASA